MVGHGSHAGFSDMASLSSLNLFIIADLMSLRSKFNIWASLEAVSDCFFLAGHISCVFTGLIMFLLQTGHTKSYAVQTLGITWSRLCSQQLMFVYKLSWTKHVESIFFVTCGHWDFKRTHRQASDDRVWQWGFWGEQLSPTPTAGRRKMSPGQVKMMQSSHFLQRFSHFGGNKSPQIVASFWLISRVLKKLLSLIFCH